MNQSDSDKMQNKMRRQRRKPGVVRQKDRVRRVYFVQAKSGLIKIGVANDVRRRLGSLQTFSAEPLTLLGQIVCPDHGETEKWVHGQFSHLREQGEWFRAGADLLEFIERYGMDEVTATYAAIREACQVGRPAKGFPGFPPALMISSAAKAHDRCSLLHRVMS